MWLHLLNIMSMRFMQFVAVLIHPLADGHLSCYFVVVAAVIGGGGGAVVTGSSAAMSILSPVSLHA